jgi:hypothetical protein
MVRDNKRPPPFIGHGKVNIFFIPLAKMLHFISRDAWPEEVLKSLEMEVRIGQLPFMVVYLTIYGYTSYYKWI